jgi:hypothetical protein
LFRASGLVLQPTANPESKWRHTQAFWLPQLLHNAHFLVTMLIEWKREKQNSFTSRWRHFIFELTWVLVGLQHHLCRSQYLHMPHQMRVHKSEVDDPQLQY